VTAVAKDPVDGRRRAISQRAYLHRALANRFQYLANQQAAEADRADLEMTALEAGLAARATERDGVL
jgi:hypothetical protein